MFTSVGHVMSSAYRIGVQSLLVLCLLLCTIASVTGITALCMVLVKHCASTATQMSSLVLMHPLLSLSVTHFQWDFHLFFNFLPIGGHVHAMCKSRKADTHVAIREQHPHVFTDTQMYKSGPTHVDRQPYLIGCFSPGSRPRWKMSGCMVCSCWVWLVTPRTSWPGQKFTPCGRRTY